MGIVVGIALLFVVMFGAIVLGIVSSRRGRTNAARASGQSHGQPRVVALPAAGAGRDARRRRRPRGRRTAATLPPEATVSFGAERDAAGTDSVLAALDRDLIGLVPVKRKVEEIASLLLVDHARRRFGMTAPRPSLHMCFTGPPGTGKTTMAVRMAELLHSLGYLERGQLVHAMRDDLVAEFVGQTAPRTRKVLDRAMGGVLFIDEAYYLYRASDSKDYGQEAIEMLLQVMENERENLVVILAGYKDRMEEFFSSNPGMGSRIAHHLDFAPYEVDELVSIGRLMLAESSYYLSDQAESVLRENLANLIGRPGFANARTVRNELDQARLRHARRLVSEPERERSRDDLMRLEQADLLDAYRDLGLAGPSLPASIDKRQPAGGH